MTDVVARLQGALQDRYPLDRELEQGGIASRLLSGLGLAALGLLASVRLATGQCPDGTPPPCARAAHQPSVAVLLMELRSRNAADSLLAEGLTLEIINTLSGVTRLDVKSRFFSRRIAAAADPVRSARSFGVEYVVDGVLELDSARVLVRGALTRTSTARVVRPIRVERRRGDLEALQAAVAQEGAAAVVGQLLPSERARFAVRRVDPRVAELLLSARAVRQQYTQATLLQARALVLQALAIDSTYAPAWAELSLCYSWLSDFDPAAFPQLPGTSSERSFDRQSRDAGERAFALDSSDGTVMSITAGLRASQNDLSPRTEALARIGAAREPNIETTVILERVLLDMGQSAKALAVIREATRRDSLSPVIWAASAYRLFNARHFAEAAGAWERALELRPSAQDSATLRMVRSWARLETGDCAGSLADGRSAHVPLLIIESLRCLRRTVTADSIADSLLASPTIPPSLRAILLAWRSQPDSAFAVLDRAYPRRLGLIIQHPAFDPYRRHPAYLALLRRMGLEQQ